MTTVHRSRYWGVGRRRGHGGRRADATPFSSSASDAFAAVMSVVLFVVVLVSLTIFVVERDDSPSTISFAAASARH